MLIFYYCMTSMSDLADKEDTLDWDRNEVFSIVLSKNNYFSDTK